MNYYIHKESRKIISETDVIELAGARNEMFVLGWLKGANYEAYTRPIREVSVFTRPSCSQCKQLKIVFDRLHIHYDEIQDDEQLLAASETSGILEAPIVRLGDSHYISYLEAVKRAADIKEFVKGADYE